MKLRVELFDGEQVLTATRAHPRTLLPAVFQLLLAVLLASFASTLYPSAPVLGALGFVAAVLLLVKVAQVVLRWVSKQFFLTTYRVVATGRGAPLSVSLMHIRGVNVSHRGISAVYGDLLIRAQTGDYLMRGIPYPQKFSALTRQAQQNILGGLG